MTEAYRCGSCVRWHVDADPGRCGVWGRCSLPDDGETVALIGRIDTVMETVSDHSCREWRPRPGAFAPGRALVYRYVSEGAPTLLETWDEFVGDNYVTPGQILNAFGRREKTIRAALAGERALDFRLFVHVSAFLALDHEEALARHVASLSPARIGEMEAADRRIAEALAAARDSSALPP
jgi:hypothetical protein